MLYEGRRLANQNSRKLGGGGDNTGSPLKFHFQIPCVFTVRLEIVPGAMCDDFLSLYHLSFESGKLKFENKYPLCFPCVSTYFQIPCVFLTGIYLGNIPCFACVVGTLVLPHYSNIIILINIRYNNAIIFKLEGID